MSGLESKSRLHIPEFSSSLCRWNKRRKKLKIFQLIGNFKNLIFLKKSLYFLCTLNFHFYNPALYCGWVRPLPSLRGMGGWSPGAPLIHLLMDRETHPALVLDISI